MGSGRPNRRMKLTRLSAAPGWSSNDEPGGGAASCPRRRETAGTASQLIAGVRRTYPAIPRDPSSSESPREGGGSRCSGEWAGAIGAGRRA
jgi:hypothetical protein